MAKINGFFEAFLDQELYEKLHRRSKAIRAYCLVRFKTATGFTKPYPAIIDTGAHTSLLPLEVWNLVQYEILGEHYVAGLVPSTKLDVKVGELSLIFVDLLNTSKEYKFLCFLSPSDRIPLILGFKELLSEFKLVVDYPRNVVWLEEK